MQMAQNRRRFLATLSAAGAAIRRRAEVECARGRLETTTVQKVTGTCIAPQYVPRSCCA